MNNIFSIIESHPVLVGIFVAVCTMIGGFIKYIYPKKTNKNFKIRQSYHINQVNSGNGQYIGNHYNLSSGVNDSLNVFIMHLNNSTWRKENIDDSEVWICESDETYQIHSKDNYENFTETWTQIYPNKFGSKKHSVLLKIKGISIKEITFVYCDGGRISVPLPELEIINEKQIFYWDVNSLECKIGKVIGHFYIYNSIEGVARQSKIELRNI